MADSPLKSPLQKPPGYKDPNVPPRPVAPPPGRKAPVPPAPFRRRKTRRNCCRTCCCVFFFLLLFFIAVAGLASALLYLLLDPKLPVFHLQSFRISEFDVATRPDGSYLDAKVAIRVEFKNPNDKLAVMYGKIGYEVTVGKDTEFGWRSVPGFTQPRKNATSLKVETEVENKALDVEDGAKMVGQFKSKELAVKVEAQTTVGLSFQGWRIGPLPVDLQCHTKLKSIDGGTMPKCTINLFKWINIH